MNVQMYIRITGRLIGSRKFSGYTKHSFDSIPEEYWMYL